VSHINITRCSFEVNQALSGGSVFVQGAVNLAANSTSFSYSKAFDIYRLGSKGKDGRGGAMVFDC
jgi:hypothetical protein